ncbi:hypothetical protein M9H77_06814 [Catharanthus roseus]|uniref:Uncharacterized protein n=1 Tax=Catharanthus roseus TaxID=4058 RepID=A0ACC0BTC5_CATRO|nr:hypothetical protein M9H77_06814 [Catharanthus roseus]
MGVDEIGEKCRVREVDGRDWRKKVDKISSGDVSCIPPMRGKQVDVGAINKRQMFMARQAISSPCNLGEGDSQQRGNLFYTCCQILDKTCSLVIGGGSFPNLVSSYVIGKLGIRYMKHPKHYKLQ